ncbi:hypothetical protein [Leminorella grimontii]|uniref:hypothetical protein n=1 Tax=Leminorella grimontii TaxID=82981 RepID=UPI00208295BC|nr:hypothetical protein [Leminorella grimontii]GKX60737.1 hypothetical protein SOASR031_30520 [Leminorella grimontii]
MPIDLTKIPQPLEPPKGMKLLRWGILLLVFMATGSLTTLGVSRFCPLSDFWFWFLLLAAPFLLWLLSFFYGIYVSGYRDYYVEQWNKRCEQRRQELINLGQKPLLLLENIVFTQHGTAGHARRIIKGQTVLQAQVPSSGGMPIPHSALPLKTGQSSSDHKGRLENIFDELKPGLMGKISSVRKGHPLHLRLFIDTKLERNEVVNIFRNSFNGADFTSVIAVPCEESETYLDGWLNDPKNDNALLCVIGCRLFELPTDNDAEAVVALLMAGEKAFKKIKDKSSDNKSDSPIAISRTERQTDITRLFDNALLWGNFVDEKLGTVWTSDITPEMNASLATYLNERGLDAGETYNMDSSIGHAGGIAYWLTIAVAAEHAKSADEKQFVICGQSQTAALVVSKYKMGEAVKETA